MELIKNILTSTESNIIGVVSERGTGKTTFLNKILNLDKTENFYVHSKIFNFTKLTRPASIFELILADLWLLLDEESTNEDQFINIKKQFINLANNVGFQNSYDKTYYETLAYSNGLSSLAEIPEFLGDLEKLLETLRGKKDQYIFLFDDLDIVTTQQINLLVNELNMVCEAEEMNIKFVISYNETQFFNAIYESIEYSKQSKYNFKIDTLETRNDKYKFAQRTYEKLIPLDNRRYLQTGLPIKMQELSEFKANAPIAIKKVLPEKTNMTISKYIICKTFELLNMPFEDIIEEDLINLSNILPSNYRGLNQLVQYLNLDGELDINYISILFSYTENSHVDFEKLNLLYNSEVSLLNYNTIYNIDISEEHTYFKYLNELLVSRVDYSYADVINCFEYMLQTISMDKNELNFIYLCLLTYLVKISTLDVGDVRIKRQIIGTGQLSKAYVSRASNQKRDSVRLYTLDQKNFSEVMSIFGMVKSESDEFYINSLWIKDLQNSKSNKKAYLQKYSFTSEFIEFISSMKSKFFFEDNVEEMIKTLICLEYIYGFKKYNYVPMCFDKRHSKGKRNIKVKDTSIETFLLNKNFILKNNYHNYNLDAIYVNDKLQLVQYKDNHKTLKGVNLLQSPNNKQKYILKSSNYGFNLFHCISTDAFLNYITSSKLELNIFKFRKFNTTFTMRQTEESDYKYVMKRFFDILGMNTNSKFDQYLYDNFLEELEIFENIDPYSVKFYEAISDLSKETTKESIGALRKKANLLGVKNTTKLTKKELIRQIELLSESEGNSQDV